MSHPAAAASLPLLSTYDPPATDLDRVARRALLVGSVAGVLCIVGAALDPKRFFQAYLVGFMYWLSIAVGCLAISMLHHLSGGNWGVMIRRILEAASRTLPYVFAAFLPLLLGLHQLYEWSHVDVVRADEALRHKAAYLNAPFFSARAVLYFAVWAGIAVVLSRLSLRQDQTGDPTLTLRMQKVSAAGLMSYILTMTFASIDWLMSLNPHWASTIYGFYVVIGQAISAMAFTILVALFLADREPMAGRFQATNFHDCGKLLLAFVMMWAYFSVSQFLIIWSGNLPEEISWYMGRMKGAWRFVSLLLVLLHFALPFVLLLSRDLKRDVRRLSRVAVLLLVMRWLDLYWLAAPAFSPDAVRLHWLDIAVPVALGGFWIWLFIRELKGRSLLPVNEPYLKGALGHE